MYYNNSGSNNNDNNINATFAPGALQEASFCSRCLLRAATVLVDFWLGENTA